MFGCDADVVGDDSRDDVIVWVVVVVVVLLSSSRVLTVVCGVGCECCSARCVRVVAGVW